MPKSYSIFRGQSEKGVGEGPGRPVSFGEQYLGYTPGFPWDEHFPGEIRPWMQMTASRRLHRELEGQLTGWSLFTAGEYQLVVRISSVLKYSSYDARPAYFAHGRAYRVSELSDMADPGIMLGDIESFDDPWPPETWPDLSRQPASGEPALRGAAMQELLGRVTQALNAREDAAERLLGQVYNARLNRTPIVIAIPNQGFGSEAWLPRILAFVRAALPRSMKASLSIRIFDEDNPRVWLTQRQVALLVIDEENATKAIEAAPEALFLDRHGNVIRGASNLPQHVAAYASGVVEVASANVGGLLGFSHRVDQLIQQQGGALNSRILDALRTIYSLAFTADKPETFGHLLRHYLVGKLGGETPLPWDRLIPPRPHSEEWAEVPAEDLGWLAFCDDLPLANPGEEVDWYRTAGLRELAVQELANRIEEGRAVCLDDHAAAWWSSADFSLDRLDHLLYLVDREVVSPGGAATFTQDIPTREMIRHPEVAAKVAFMEGQVPSPAQPGKPTFTLLAARGTDAEALADMVLADGALGNLGQLLFAASAQAILHPAWATRVLDRTGADGPLVRAIIEHWTSVQSQLKAREIVLSEANQLPGPPEGDTWIATWDTLLRMSLSLLVAGPATAPLELAEEIRSLLENLDPGSDAEAYVLAHYLLINQDPAGATATVEMFWEGTEGVIRQELQELIDLALGRLPRPRVLFVADGELKVPRNQIRAVGASLLGSPDIVSELPPGGLMQLYYYCGEDSPGAVAPIFEQVDAWLADGTGTASRAEVVDALVVNDAYLHWRAGEAAGTGSWSGTRITDRELLADTAYSWLTSSRWADTGSRMPDPRSWRAAIEDIEPYAPADASGHQFLGGISEAETASLFTLDGDIGWPLIEGHELEQFLDLCACTLDLGALVTLHERLCASPQRTIIASEQDPWRLILERALVPEEERSLISPRHLAILSEHFSVISEGHEEGATSSLMLTYKYAGDRQDLAREYIALYMTNFLDAHVSDYLRLGSYTQLWHESPEHLLRGLEQLAPLSGELPPALTREQWLMEEIDQAVSEVEIVVPQSWRDMAAADKYLQAGLQNIAALFDPRQALGPAPAIAPDPAPAPADTGEGARPAAPTFEALSSGDLIDQVLLDLLSREPRAPSYLELVSDVKAYYGRAPGPAEDSPVHHLAMLAIRWRESDVQQQDAHKLQANVWSVFHSFLRTEREALVLARHGPGPSLPVLELFLATCRQSLEQWFVDVSSLAGIEQYLREPGWWLALRKTLGRAQTFDPSCLPKEFEYRLDGWASLAHRPFDDSEIWEAYAAAFDPDPGGH